MAEQNPLAKYQLQRIGGAARRNNEGMFTNVNGNASRDARRAARREQRPMTHAEMQADGIARPAPDMSAMFTGSQPSDSLGASMMAPETTDYTQPYTPAYSPDYTPYSVSDSTDLTTTGDVTSPVGSVPTKPQTYDAMRSAALANLRAQFAGERQALEDDLARRGLSASSFGAGRLGDLLGQQERTLASTEADLLAAEDARRNNQSEMLLRLATLFGLS